MGSGSSKMEPPVVVTSKIPLFCLKKLGPRHLLVAGGGGESKTGVLNLIQTYLITFGNQSGKKRVTRMQAQLVNTIETDIYATMNMDVVCCSNPEQGKYLIAAGHGQYCDVYETTGYAVGKDDAEKEVRKESEKSVQDSVEKEMQNGVREQVHGVAVEENKDGNEKEVLDDDKRRLLDDAKEEVQNDTRKEVRADAKKTVQNDADNGDLSLNIRFVGRLTTSEKVESFQKCVRFDRSTSGRRVVTGGEDGRIRVWNAKALVEDRNPETIHKPTLDIEAHKSDVFDIDIASDGRIIISVGHDGVAKMWDMNLGTLIREIPMPNDCATGYKVRSVRCTPLGSGSNLVFVAAYNAVSITSKRKTYLALWAFSRETQSLRTVTVRSTGQGDGIASLCVSSCGNFTGVGTMGGSVYIYDTHEMKQLAAFKETHGIFVTAVEFLDRTAADVASLITQPPSGPPRKVPGPAYGARASLISLSADQTIQVHNLPKEKRSASLFLVRLFLISLISYYVIWCLSFL